MNGRPAGLQTADRKISRLPEYPEDALLESLDALAIPAELRQDYLSLQLTALPGWAGFIKWRAEERDYEWQRAYPVGLVKYLAIRLWYVRELVQKVCREELGIDGQYQAVTAYMQRHPSEYFLRRERVAGRLPAAYAEEVDRLRHQHRERLGEVDRALQDGRRSPPGTSRSAWRRQATACARPGLGHRSGCSAGQFTGRSSSSSSIG